MLFFIVLATGLESALVRFQNAGSSFSQRRHRFSSFRLFVNTNHEATILQYGKIQYHSQNKKKENFHHAKSQETQAQVLVPVVQSEEGVSVHPPEINF